ncbi:MAG: Iron-containing alcohol dehydrogenase [Thermodesulfobacteriota bacterium]|nr:Iron-containing alcohol dehydrogenase [Thermodesulfobacteriota bacterium]
MKYPDLELSSFFMWSNRPRIMFGPGIRSELGFEMNALGGKKAVIITDKGIVGAGVAGMVAKEIEKSELKLVGIFDSIVQDARIDIINQGAAFYREKGADCMVVVGGGSVMDSAKGINILIGEGTDDFQPLADRAALWDDAKPLPPHIVFPTTAGTASEVTHAIIALDVNARVKLQITHPYNADIAMLDPELTVKLPPKITAFTGMDALTHAIEGVTSTSVSPIGDALGLHAIRLIFKYLPVAVNEPEDITARGYMLIASTLAGMCFGNTMTGAVHATAHALGAHYGIPHGLANGIMLPVVMEYNVEEAADRYMLVADAMGLDVNGMEPIDAARAAVQGVKDLKKAIGLTEKLKDLGVPDDREKLMPTVELAGADSQISYNPRFAEEEDILNFYLKAL